MTCAPWLLRKVPLKVCRHTPNFLTDETLSTVSVTVRSPGDVKLPSWTVVYCSWALNPLPQFSVAGPVDKNNEPSVSDVPDTFTLPAADDTVPLHDGAHGIGGVTVKHSVGEPSSVLG